MDPLTELIPPKARKWVYVGASLASTGFALYEAVQGDWKQFAAGMLSALVTALARANVNPPAAPAAGGGDHAA